MKRKLPPIYVVVDADGFAWASSANRTKEAIYGAWGRRMDERFSVKGKGDRIVKYVPSPTLPKRTKGGKRG